MYFSPQVLIEARNISNDTIINMEKVIRMKATHIRLGDAFEPRN
jgi:hypothetical protein